MINILLSRIFAALEQVMNAMLSCLTFSGAVGAKNAFSLRDFGPFKKFFRLIGVDRFDDFEFVVVVHDVHYDYTKGKFPSQVRIRAWNHWIETTESRNGSFQQPFAIFVEQGTRNVNVELVDKSKQQVIAVLQLDPVKDIMTATAEGPIKERLYTMTSKKKAITNARIRLSLTLEEDDGMEEGLLDESVEKAGQASGHVEGGGHTSKVAENPEMHALIERLPKVYTSFGQWGQRSKFMVVIGPPEQKRYVLTIWNDQGAFERGEQHEDTVDLLKVRSVTPSPQNADTFQLNYVDKSKENKEMTLQSAGLSRNETVKMFIRLIGLTHELK